MTVIVAIEKEGVVYMGADTCRSCGKRKENVSIGEFAKIERLDNGLLIGISGKVRAHQLLMAHKEFFSFVDDKLTKDGIVREFLPAVKKLFAEEKMLDEDGFWLISMMLAKDGDLFVIKSSGLTYRVSDYAIGSGSDYALAALRDERETVENRLLNGMRIASGIDVSVGAPYVLIDTKEKKYREVQE